MRTARHGMFRKVPDLCQDFRVLDNLIFLNIREAGRQSYTRRPYFGPSPSRKKRSALFLDFFFIASMPGFNDPFYFLSLPSLLAPLLFRRFSCTAQKFFLGRPFSRFYGSTVSIFGDIFHSCRCNCLLARIMGSILCDRESMFIFTRNAIFDVFVLA